MCHGNMQEIQKYREECIGGRLLSLVPVSEEHFELIIRLRNKERNRYFFNQQSELTFQGQEQWFREYLLRDNDIYWVLSNQEDKLVGTMRLYDIDKAEGLCSQGSFIVDENYADEAPYALEAELLSLDFAFHVLQLQGVVNEDRGDNKIMNNLSKKMGFEFVKHTYLNNIEYNYYILKRENYLKARGKIDSIVEYWVRR